MNEDTSPESADVNSDQQPTAEQGAGPTGGDIHEAFQKDQYLIRQKVFKLLGAAFHIYDADGNLAFYSNQKAFKLKEDIRVYGDEAMTNELLTIKARGIIDFGMTYDVIDSSTETAVGALRRKGLKSMIRDEWVILDVDDNEIGLIQEESGVLALARRFSELFSFLSPQKFIGFLGDAPVLQFKQNRNPFVKKIALDYGQDVNNLLDRRLGIAAAVLLIAIEGRQS